MKWINAVCLLVLFFTSVYAQAQKIVTGTVLDYSGTPLPGVSILVKGSSTGTSRNFDVNYSIAGPNTNSILVFSYGGFINPESEYEGCVLLAVVTIL